MIKTPAPCADQRGFSIVEVMIAALILLVVAIGVLPLFVNSIVANAQGQDSTSAANFARSRLEEFKSMSFTDPRLTIAAGTERQFDEIYLFNAKKWIDGTVPPAGDWALWSRTTWVRQYQSIDSTQPPPYLTTPLPASTDPTFVHLKEIEVRVVSNRNTTGGKSSFGGGKAISARVFKAA